MYGQVRERKKGARVLHRKARSPEVHTRVLIHDVPRLL